MGVRASTTAAGLVTVALALSACGSTSFAGVDCQSGVTVDLSSLKQRPELWGSASLCIGTVCQVQPVTGREDYITLDLGAGSSSTPTAVPVDSPVTVVLSVSRGTTALTAQTTTVLAASRPNGPGYDPVCWSSALVLRGSALTQTTPDQSATPTS